jgi:hypothetical protein
VRGPIRPRRLEAKGQPFVIDDLQSSRRQRWSGGVADQAFQAGAVVVVDAGRRSEAVLFNVSTVCELAQPVAPKGPRRERAVAKTAVL